MGGRSFIWFEVASSGEDLTVPPASGVGGADSGVCCLGSRFCADWACSVYGVG